MKYKLVCFDLDGTLVDDTIFIWQTLHDHFGTDKDARKEMIEKFLRKEVTYQQWADHDVVMLKKKGATKDKIITLIKKLKLMRGAKDTVGKLKAQGIKLAVISGSLDIVLDTLFPDHPFDDVLINKFEFDNEGNLMGCVATKYDIEHKATGLKMIAKREGFDLSECVFVGDNHNDIHVAEIAGLAIAFNSKSETFSEMCDVVIPNDVQDMRAILPHILGK